MQKRLFIFLLTTITALLLFVSTANAQFASYTSGFQVANLSNSTAAIVITYYNQDGTVDATVNDTIAANASNTYFPLDASAGFNGSVVISSDQEVAAITNVLGDGGAAGASYESFSAGAPSVSLPIIMKGNFGFDTWFNVQNSGTSQADVTVTYANTACTENATIEAGAAATFDQSTNSCLTSGYVGAATVTVADTASDSIVATVMQQNGTQLLAYNGFTGGSTNPVMPLVQANNFGFSTGIQIQNTGGSSTNVTVTYAAGSAGTNCTEQKSIPAGASKTFALEATCTKLNGPTFVGAATVTGNSSGQPLAAIVNQSNFSNSGSAYNGINPANATSTVNFPLIMKDNFGYFTGFNVYNAGGSSASVNCTFSAGSNKPANFTQSIPSGGVHTAVQTGTGQYVGSATCTASGGTLVGVANELGNAAGDQFFAYGGFNQ